MTDEERQRGAQEAAMKRWGKPPRIASDHFSFVGCNTIVIDWGAVIS